jgi:glucose-6-phosphate 1-dehydrogenase
MKHKNSASFALVIFGVTGNLAQLKLIPALYDLAAANLLPEKMSIIGIGRKPYTDEEFRQYAAYVLTQPNIHHPHPILPEVENKLLRQMIYVSGDISTPRVYQKLSDILNGDLFCSKKLFYLATYPDLYSVIFNHLETQGLNRNDCGWVRVIIEKPIGSDFESARKLNLLLGKYYVEDQIFRLDHYLGKETLQNILMFRFGNGIYEPLMNNKYIDHIQVTVAEDFGIGWRGGYYDSVGALKDVGQNHILQMIALTTMDAPIKFTNPAVTKSRIDLIRSLVPDPKNIVFGQYQGYRNEKGVKVNSLTDTFFAFRTFINNERFKGVPIYVRAGKSLAQTVTEVSIIFKVDHKRLFKDVTGGLEPNILIYRIQPNEGIVFKILTKTPGTELKLQEQYMQFCYRQFGKILPDPHVRLLFDAFHGDQTFFTDAPEVEVQWKFTDPLSAIRGEPEIYKPGSWGPKAAHKLIESDGRKWLIPSPVFCAL